VARVDEAVDQALLTKKEESEDLAGAKDEIRTFALDHLISLANQIEAAQRLGQLWGGQWDVEYDPAALARAQEERKRIYLQWEDVMPNRQIPNLLSEPRELLEAFDLMAQEKKNNKQGKTSIIWGFDAEWDGDDSSMGGGVSLLQLATVDGGALLIDIPSLCNSGDEGYRALERTVGRLFSGRLYQSETADEEVVVVGFACKQDIGRLRKSASSVPHSSLVSWLHHGTAAVVDLKATLLHSDLNKHSNQKQSKRRDLSLSRVCKEYFGKKLDKSEQCSAWGARPLSLDQRKYAALDAYICAAAYEKLILPS